MKHASAIVAAIVTALGTAACSFVTPTKPRVVYEFVCLNPADCDGDGNFRVTFEFDFAA